MSNFQELVKNLYTSKNRELTEEKLQYIEKNYKDKEQDFVKNFYTTIGEELTEEKFNYINDKYLKKKENTNSQSSVGSSVSQESNQASPQANTSQNKTVAPQSNASRYAVDPSEIPSADEIKQSQAKRKEQDAKLKPYAQQPINTIVGDNSQITTADPFGVYGQGSASQQRANKVVYTPERSYEINQDLVKRKDYEIRSLEKTIEINKGSYLPGSNGGMNYSGIEKDLQRLEALKKEREGLAKIADKSLENVKPEIESLSKSAIKENLSNFTTKGKSSKGEITVPNQQAIIEYADKEAEKRGLEKGGYYSRLIQNQLSGEVSFKIIEPQVNKEFETIFEKRNGAKINEYKTVPQKSQEILIKNGEQLKAQHELSKDKVLSSIKSEYQPEYSAVENQYKTNIGTIKIAQESDVELQTLLQQQSEQLGVKYQQEVNSGKLSVEEATRLYNEEYNQIATKTYNDKYLPLFGEAYNEYLNQFNGINKKLNQRAEREISELNRVFGDKLKSIDNELKSIPNKDPEFDTKVQLAYKEAYNKVLKENHQELNQGEQGWGAFGAGWRSFKSSLGSSLKDISSALGFRDLEAYWASMETENVSIPEPIKQASDLLDLSKVLKGTGQLGGTMLPTMLPAVAVTLATGGTATGALLGAGVSFMSETIMMSESVKQDVFAETGSVAKAEQASTEMVKSQLENMWTYSLDMLPFTNWLSKPLRGINKAVSIPLRFGINAGIEVGTETIQEFKQGAAEQSILKYGVRDFASEFETPQALKETFFTVTPTALFGGLGQIKSISNELITERKVGNNMATIRANAIIAQNMGANGMNQYVSNMVNEQGADYTSVAIQNMYKEGLISKEILDQSLQTIDRTEKSISTATSLGLDKGQAKVFNAITEDINSARQELANAYSQFARNILEDRIKQLEREASNFANTGKTERAILTLQNGQQYVATAENLANMLHNEEFAQSVENGDVQVNMDGAEKMGMYDIYLNSIGTPKLESVADKIRNNETLTPSEKIIYDRNKSEIDRYNKNMESENKSESTKQSPADTKQEEVKVKQEPKAEQEQTQKPQEYKIEELADKEVEYNGEKGTLSIDEGGKVTIETEDAIYEVNANSTDNAFENNIVYNEEYVPKTIEVQDENNISLDGENYTIITDDKGNITQLKGDNGNVIENQDVLIQAEVQRNKKLDNPRIEQAIENDTEVAVQEIKSVSPNTEVVDNLLNYNMTDNVSDALDKLYDGEELTEQEALSSELYISDAIERLEKLKSERPELSESVDRVINGLYNASNILDKVKQNGKRKSAKATKKEAKQTTNKPTVSEPKPRGEETVTREEVKVSPADTKVEQPKKEVESKEKEPNKVKGEEGKSGEIKFAEGVVVPFKYKLIEADDLQPSHLPSGARNPEHTIANAQPKERNDIGSKMAQDNIAKNPNLNEVGESPNPYFGAPIITPNGEVIQGNNRAIGIKKHHDRKGSSYKQQLVNNAEKFGLTKEQVANMKNPILVRQVAVDDNVAVELGNYDVKDLETGGKQRVDAVTTVRKMKEADKSKLASLIFGEEYGTVKEAIKANASKVINIIGNYINTAQRNTIINKDGQVTAKGMDDIQAIVHTLLFDKGSSTLPEVFETITGTAQKNIHKAIKYIFSVDKENSLLPELQNAMLALYDFGQSGINNINEWKNQSDLFKGVTPSEVFTPLELKLAEILTEAKTQSELAKAMAEYANLVNGTEGDMFTPTTEGISKKEAIEKQFKVDYNETDNTKTESNERVEEVTSEKDIDKSATESKPKETVAEAKVEPIKEAPKEKIIDEAKQTEGDVNAETERATPEESGRDTKEKPKEITKPKNKQELADKIRDVFGLSKKKAKAVADIIGLSAKSLVKAGVFNSEKEFWDSLPEFSKEKPDNISDDQYQSAKGLYSSIKNMIYNLTGGDVSTVLHEVSHWWLDNIDRSANQGNKQAKAMQFTLDNFAKSTEGIKFWKANFGGKFDAKNYKYRQELFARSYERYLYDGVAPTPKLKQIFDDISQWFKEIYASIADIDINLSDGMRSLYGKILSYDEVQLVEDDFVQQSESEIRENLSENIKLLDALNEELSDFDAFDLFQNNSDIEQIKQKAISDGTFMKAPNGKDTNLTERQWLQVRSKAFISWFGDWQNDPKNASKVVDGNGEPLVVYHTSDAEFSKFDKDKIGKNYTLRHGNGFYFSSGTLGHRQWGSSTKMFFINIRNIRKSSLSFREEAKENGFLNTYDNSVDIASYAKKIGVDGLFAGDSFNKELIVFEPNQIKSATDNVGAFDNNNPDILFQARQNERQQAVDNIQKWADVAKGKNPNIKKSEFIEILKNNSTTKKIFDHFTEKEVGDIFVNTEVDTSLFDAVVENSMQENVTNGTSERRYINRVVQDAESLGFQEYMDEVEKLEGKADRISQESVEKIAEKLFQSMLNADNIDVAFLAFLNYASTRVFSAKEGSILPTMSAQVFHKIIAYYKQNGDIKNAKRWIELFSGSGRALGQFISAMQESSTPEAIANKITDKIAEENNKALDKVQDGGKTGKEIMESTAETLKTTKEESKNLVDNGKKTNEAKNKAVSKSKPSKKAIKDTELSDTQKKLKESAKAKAKSFFEIAKGEGLFQISGKLKDIAKGMVDDILSMGAKSKEIAFATYSSIMEEQGVPSEIISESFNEVWSADQDAKVKDNMSDYIAEKVISGSKTKPKKVTDKTNPLDMVANVLIARATEIIPESARQTAKKTIPAIERLAELIKNKEIAESAWRKAMNEVRNQIEVNPMLTDMEKAEMIAQLEDDISNFMSNPLPKSLVRKAVKTGAKDLGVEINKVIQESLESQTETGDTIAKNLIDQLGLDADTAQELQDAVMEDWNDMLSEAKERALEIQLEKDLKKKVRDADLAKKRAERQAELDRKRAEREKEKAELKAERERLREIERQNKINEKERKKAEERIKKLVGLINNPKPNTSKGKDLIDNIMEAVNGGVLDDAVLKQAFENQFGLRTLTPEQETKLRNFVKLLSTDLGIEYKGRIARDFADFLKSLEPRTAVAVYEFAEGAIVSMSLSGLVTNTLNIPVGTASIMTKSYLAKLATSPIGMWNAIQDFAKTNQSGIGRSASKSALKTGYNQLADINEVFSNEPRIKGSLNRYIFNNIGERKQKLDDRLDKSAQKKNAIARALFMAGNFYYEANITALSLFQAVINLNSAFDPLLANRLGEYYNYVNLYNLEVEKNKQNKLNKTRGEILDSVREKMGYNQIQQDNYTQKAQDIARILSSYGIELSDADIQRESKWQMLASREQEVVEQAYEEVSNASMMGKPYGVFGKMLESTQRLTQYNRNPESKSDYIANAFKFAARVNLMLFSRVATMSLNTAVKAIPILGALNSFYTYKPNKNGKWDFQLNSKEEIRRNLIGDAVILATYVGLLAHMFDWDDEDETFVLNPNRLIDMTLDVGAITKDYKRGDLEEDYTPLAIRVRTSSDKEFKRWQGVKYGLPIIPIVAMLGGLSDRINYKTSDKDYKEEQGDDLTKPSIKKKIAKKDLLINAYPDVARALGQLSFNQTLRTIGDIFTAINPSTSADTRERKFTDIVANTSKPYKQLVVPFTSNISRDIINITASYLDVEQPKYTKVEKIFWNGFALADFVASASRSEDRVLRDRFGNKLPRQTFMHQLTYALNTLPFINIENEGMAELQKKTIYQIINSKEHEGMAVPKEISISSTNFGKILKNRETPENLKIQVLNEMSKEWGRRIEEKLGDGKWKNMTEDEIYAIMYREKTKAKEYIEKVGYETINGKSVKIHKNLYKINPKLYLEIFPEYSNK